MSDEYLFEKQGSDTEIERLEGLLAGYRIQPVVPQIARTETSVDKPGIFAWLKVGYAVALVAAITVFGLSIVAVRNFVRTDREVVAISPAQPPEIDRPFVAPSVIDRTSVDNIDPDNEPLSTAKRSPRIVPAAMRRHERHRPTSNAIAQKTPRLTKEEKYAYDQLMVALWITGSKLKVVQDTINRVDDTRSEPANDKR